MRIRVISGPAFRNRKATTWIGDPGEDKVAVPDFYWKIVVRQQGDSLQVMAFFYPHKDIKKTSAVRGKKYSQAAYLVSIDDIEFATGLDFFSALSNQQQDSLERKAATSIWR